MSVTTRLLEDMLTALRDEALAHQVVAPGVLLPQRRHLILAALAPVFQRHQVSVDDVLDPYYLSLHEAGAQDEHQTLRLHVQIQLQVLQRPTVVPNEAFLERLLRLQAQLRESHPDA